MQKKLITYATIATMLAVVLAPSLALAIVQPTVPIGNPGQAVTAGSFERLINSIVQFMITISIVIAVGYIVWGGIQYIRGDAAGGMGTLKNGVIGVAIILGVGLILQTVARFVNTGGQIN